MPQLFVQKKLNKRSRIPTKMPDDHGIVDTVPKGHLFFGTEVKGSTLSSPLDKWYQDLDGYYYWGGAISEIFNAALPGANLAAAGAVSFDPGKMSWAHQFYNIPLIWSDLETRGKGVTVAVIDTGIDDSHPDLISNIHPLSKSFIGSEKDISDSAGHGTNMAGIIAASGSLKVFGVAPESRVLIVKATTHTNGVDLKIFANAVNYAASIPDVDIVSISYSFLIDDPGLKKAIQNCIDAKKIVVAAIGNRRNSSKPEDDDTHPACYNTGFPGNTGVIAVGAFDKNGHLCSFSNWNKHLCFISPGDFSVLTTGVGNASANGSLTSIATAFTAGSLAVMISYLKSSKPQHISNCVKTILDSCDDIGSTLGFDERAGYGRLNLRNAVAKIKRM